MIEISKSNTEMGHVGSSLKSSMDGALKAFIVKVRPADESGPAKSFFVSQTPLDHTILYDNIQRESLVDQTLEENDIDCGAQGYTSIGSWLRAIEYAEIVDCEGYEDLVFDIGGEEADEQLIDSYNYLLREFAGLRSHHPYNVLRLSDTSKLGRVIKRRGYLAVRSRLNSPFDNYLCILDPRDMRSWVTADFDRQARKNPKDSLVLGTTEVQGYYLTWVTANVCDPQYTPTEFFSNIKFIEFEGVDEDTSDLDKESITLVTSTFDRYEYDISRLLKETGLETNTVIILSPERYIDTSEYPPPEGTHLVFVACSDPLFKDHRHLLQYLAQELLKIADVGAFRRKSKEWANLVDKGKDLTLFFNDLEALLSSLNGS